MTKSPRSVPANEAARKWALLEELRRQGIADKRVIEVMAGVPRAFFLDPELADEAWRNVALAISHQQTISQPFVVALMTQALALDGSERVLEIGTGSGYQAAILAELAREVITIERIPALAATAGFGLAAEAGANVAREFLPRRRHRRAHRKKDS